MRTLTNTGLIRVEAHQWPAVEAALVRAGYTIGREKGSNHKLVWDRNFRWCVAQSCPEDRCYYVDEELRFLLPRPVGRGFRNSPWVDIGGEG